MPAIFLLSFTLGVNPVPTNWIPRACQVAMLAINSLLAKRRSPYTDIAPSRAIGQKQMLVRACGTDAMEHHQLSPMQYDIPQGAATSH